VRFPEVPLKHLVRLNPESLADATPGDYEFDYIDISNVAHGRGVVGVRPTTFRDAPLRARRVVRSGDVIVSTVRTYLRASARIDDARDRAVCSTGFAVLRPERIVSRFLAYATDTPAFVQEVGARSTGISYPAINAGDLVRIRVPAPSRSLQQQIADFLDRECERIAQLDSGLDRLRKRLVAAHYERQGEQLFGGTPTIRLKYLIESIANGDWGSDAGSADVDLSCVRVTDFDRERLSLRSLGVPRSYAAVKAASIRLREGDLILEKSGGGEKSPVGFVVRCGSDAEGLVCSNFVARIRTIPAVDSRWLVHIFGVLYARRMNQPFVKQVTGIQNLDVQGYLDTRVPLLPTDAQRHLAVSAQHSLDKALETSAVVSRARARLAEYRDALVTEAVTGQLDVAKVSEAQMDDRLNAAVDGHGTTGTLTPAAR
jgi:type I restriction enzyme, S subunit